MKLTRLEIFGFKSFPQRTDIRFDEGITGIVGPNGSGKSNIADAVRWVLGEQSAKALRGARMEDVIFAGTQKRRLMPYCEVSLIFDNQDGCLRNPHSEVMVTRRAYRSGEGEYYLNKKSCRLKDIVELFHDTGIGREGYSIIGQGHIDVILSGRGEERRAAFEDAAGIVGFRSRKEEAERKLARTQEHLLRVGDLLEELGSRLDPLKEQSETARAYLALSAQLKNLDANIFLARHERLSKRIASLKETQRGIMDLIALHEADIARCQQERQLAEERLSEAETENEQFNMQLRMQESSLREQVVLMERSAQLLQNAREESKKNAEAIKVLGVEILELEQVLSGSQSAAEQNDQLLREADEQLSLLEKKAAAAFLEQNEREITLEAHRSVILQSANSKADARERHARQQAMLNQAQSRMKEVLDNENSLRDAVITAKQVLEAAKEKLAKTQETVQELSAQLAASEKELERCQQEARTAHADFSSAQNNFQRDKTRFGTLEEMARAHEGFFQPVKQALLYGEGNPKIHGAVAHLIKVPRELETALEMVLGSALQNIVTQDEETAQELINFLRENRFGRTTFLPLSAVSGRTLNQSEKNLCNLPGCLGLASELVTYDPKYRGIVESLLGRTVIARDLDAAIAISRAGRQAFHVVTLQGDVMRAGGAMTGGSVQNRTVSLLGRERELKELAESLTLQAERLTGLQTLYQDALARVKALDEQIKAERLHTQDEEIGIAREEEQFKQAKENLNLSQTRLEQSVTAKIQLGEMIAELESDLSQADEASRLIDQDRELMEKKDAQLKEALVIARELAETARDALDKKREARAQMAHRLDLLARDRNRFEKDLASLTAKKEKLLANIKLLEEKLLVETGNQNRLAKQTEAMNTAAEALRIKASQSEASRRALSTHQKQMMDESEQAHLHYSEDSQKLHKGEISLTRLEEELHAITAALWNTYELTYALAEALRAGERFDLPAGEREAGEIRREIKEMGAINIHAVDEYAATKARFDDLQAQRDDAQKAREDLLNLIKRLQSQMEKQFVREFALLNEYFSETFKRLFSGGQASLSLSDPGRPLDCEIQIKAQPPGKKLQLLSLLSGGERTLTAIAILFAMLKLKPTPFCILDEIEAALDDTNIHSFAQYLAEYAKGTQFIVITHRKGTMERCDTLYGVTMREKGVSDMISVNLQEYTA